MSDKSIWYNKANSAKEGFNLASSFLESSEVKRKFPVEVDFTFINLDSPQIIGKGNGFEVTLTFFDSEVSIDLKLKLMLKPLKGRIIDSLSDEIKRVV
tara:strand:- start:434 stop:727 length:294 start_codon:yes stop_codon:yes gene_type:complete